MGSAHAIPILSNHTYTDGILGDSGLRYRDSRVSFERVDQMGFDLFIRSEPSARTPDKARLVKNEPQYVGKAQSCTTFDCSKGLAGTSRRKYGNRDGEAEQCRIRRHRRNCKRTYVASSMLRQRKPKHRA